MVALRGIAAARMGFLLAALHSVAKRVSRGQAYHRRRCCPRLPEDRTARASAATIRSSVPIFEPSRHVPKGWQRSRDSASRFSLSAGIGRSSHSSGTWGPSALASTRGQCGVGGRAFRGLTRSATEWSAARRKPIRAAVLPFRSPILKTLRPVGFRRAAAGNFRPEISEARATLREQSGSTLGTRGRQPRLCPRLLGIEECPHFREFAVDNESRRVVAECELGAVQTGNGCCQ